MDRRHDRLCPTWTARLLALAVLSGCADEDDGGSAPTLASMSLSPEQVAVGVQAMVNGSVDFSDPDGDVENLELDLASPDGTHSGMEVEISNVDGVVEGTVAFTMVVMLPAAGTYTVSAQLVDVEGNFSNTRQTPLAAQ